MKRGEVWWVEFDLSVGSEIRKTRPAVIVSNDAANRHLSRVVVVLVTSNTERLYPGEAAITVGGAGRKAMADQIMAADKRRLKNRLDTLSKDDLLAVEDAIEVHFALSRYRQHRLRRLAIWALLLPHRALTLEALALVPKKKADCRLFFREIFPVTPVFRLDLLVSCRLKIRSCNQGRRWFFLGRALSLMFAGQQDHVAFFPKRDPLE
jgi:mRNA interferase MazF